MPRDSAGQYSLPTGTLVNSGDTILVSQHNPAMQDIAQSLTNSLDRDGKGGMRAALPMNNNPIRDLAPGTDPNDAATVGQLQGVPIGAVIDYWGEEPPQGYLFAAGQELSRAEFAELFDVIGTRGGAGDGTTTFNLPDYRAVASVGRANMGGALKGLLSNFAATTLGAIFGSQGHTLTEAQMPPHNHGGSTGSAGGHSHTMTLSNRRGSNGNAGSASGWDAGDIFIQGGVTKSTSTAPAHTHAISSAGSGQSHPIVQPSIVCNKIIRIA